MFKTISFILCAAVCLSFFSESVFAQTEIKIGKTEAEKWREDLHYMAQEMPKRHKNLFHTMTRQQFDTAVKKLDERIPSLSRHQIIVEMARIVAMVGDGHTGIRNFLYDSKVYFRYYPIALYLFKDGLFVYAADPQYAKAVGGRIVKIGDASAEEAINAVKDLVFRDNEMTVKERIPLLLTTPEVLHAVGLINDMEKARFVMERQGKQETIELKPVNAQRPSNDNWAFGQRFAKLPNWVDARDISSPTPLWLKSPENYFWFEYLEDSRTMYVQYNEVANKTDESVADFSKRLFAFVDTHPVDRFVLDLRWNTGGNNYLNKPLLLGIIKSNKIDQRGKLFTIIGRRTFSAAQNLVNDLENYTNTLFVGEPTAGSPNFYGDATSIVLPNSEITVRVSTLWWQDLDSRDTRKWTGPHIAVKLSSKDYFTNNDPAIKTILGYVPKKELSEMLMEMLSKNDVASAIKLYRAFKSDSVNLYVNTESSINSLGYRLIGMNRLNQAIEIFKLNVESYPQSANVYDSLAEAYMKNGNKELAIKSYEKSLELNPLSASAVEALKILRAK
ncbi:MAG: tetratricopeptide repeat protein [Pyrinomonadaceae bacterium]